MSIRDSGIVLILALTLGLAGLVFGAFKARWPLLPGPLTRLFAAIMTAHAVFNMISINLDGQHSIIENLSALIFLLVYLWTLWCNSEVSIRAAISLALGSYLAFIALVACGQFSFDARIFAYMSGIAIVALGVAWFAHKRRRSMKA